MPYTDSLYFVVFRRHGVTLTHAGMDWQQYHSLMASLAHEGIVPVEHGQEALRTDQTESGGMDVRLGESLLELIGSRHV